MSVVPKLVLSPIKSTIPKLKSLSHYLMFLTPQALNITGQYFKLL